MKSFDPTADEATSLGLNEMVRIGRKRMGFTQKKLSELTHIDNTIISRIETGRIIPVNPLYFRNLSKALKIPLKQLETARDISCSDGKCIKEKYPNLWRILLKTMISMPDGLQKKFLVRIENRLREFNENDNALLHSIYAYMDGYDSYSKQRLQDFRPLSHYIAEWGAEIEDWVPNRLKGLSKQNRERKDK